MFNYQEKKDFTALLVTAINQRLNSTLEYLGDDASRILYDKYNEQFKTTKDNIDKIEHALGTIYKIFGLDGHFSLDIYYKNDYLDKNLKTIIETLESKVVEQPKRVLLCYSIQVDDYHFTDIITSKDKSHIDSVSESYFEGEGWFESLYESKIDDESIVDKICKFSNITVKEYLDMSDKKNSKLFDKYVDYLVSSDDVSLREFSEIVKALIPNGRGSACSSKWVTV